MDTGLKSLVRNSDILLMKIVLVLVLVISLVRNST